MVDIRIEIVDNLQASKQRSSNFELLRITSMMIVLMHVLRHGGILGKLEIGSLEYLIFGVLRRFLLLG